MWPFKSKPKVEQARNNFIELQESIETPWAMFEVNDIENDGRIKVIFNWNDAFIKSIQEMGFHAETPEDSVQLFFYTSQMKPTELTGGDETVQSSEHPGMSPNTNRMIG